MSRPTIKTVIDAVRHSNIPMPDKAMALAFIAVGWRYSQDNSLRPPKRRCGCQVKSLHAFPTICDTTGKPHEDACRCSGYTEDGRPQPGCPGPGKDHPYLPMPNGFGVRKDPRR